MPGSLEDQLSLDYSDLGDLPYCSQRATAESDTPASSARTVFHAKGWRCAHCHRCAWTCGYQTASAHPWTDLCRKQTGRPLVALFNATGGPNWNSSDNWLSDAPLGEWYGVETDGNGRVAGLDLDDNGLSGEIPPELNSLADLLRLDLGFNGLRGEIPPELGSLANLEELWLGANGLSGEIPPELGSLANLEVLTLSGNELRGEIPPELGSLANLEGLYLGINEFSGRYRRSWAASPTWKSCRSSATR